MKFKCEWCKKKVTNSEHSCTDELVIHHKGGLMYVNPKAALKNGLQIFNKAYKGK